MDLIKSNLDTKLSEIKSNNRYLYKIITAYIRYELLEFHHCFNFIYFEDVGDNIEVTTEEGYGTTITIKIPYKLVSANDILNNKELLNVLNDIYNNNEIITRKIKIGE